MPERWSNAQVLALAPDPAARTAAANLSSPGTWTGTGAACDLVWGLCQGSGKKPYQTIADLSGPAYKCSCPSPKFPCKHTLALLLAWADDRVPDQPEPADYAASWKAGRVERAAARSTPKPRSEASDKAAAKRVAQRTERVVAGLAEAQAWIRDQVRVGFTTVAAGGYRHTDQVAARMVDAQAPGIAAALRRTAGIPASGDGWPTRLLTEYANLHLLTRAHQQLATLAPELADTARAHIGYPTTAQQLAQRDPVDDLWNVIAVRDITDTTIPARRIWLRGEHTSRWALLLLFDPRGEFAGNPHATLVAGTSIDAQLRYYPTRPELRAAITDSGTSAPTSTASPAPTGVGGVLGMLDEWAAALAADPWLRELPALLSGIPIPPTTAAHRWQLADHDGHTVALHTAGSDPWTLLAVSGGQPVTIAGEWNGAQLHPLTVWHANQAVAL